MKTFLHLESWDFSDAVSVPAGKRRTLAGVCSQTLEIWCSDGGEPVLFKVLPAGSFDFAFIHDKDAEVIFKSTSEAFLSLYNHQGSTLVKGDPEKTWTTVGHRPAINPALAAVQRELRAMTLQMQQMQAQTRAKTVAVGVSQAASSSADVEASSEKPVEASKDVLAGDLSDKVELASVEPENAV